jgi:hypothetical protein
MITINPALLDRFGDDYRAYVLQLHARATLTPEL